MLSSALKLVALACSAVVVMSFVAFVADEAGHSSKATVASIARADSTESAVAKADLNVAAPTAATERQREKQHSALREKLDDGNDILVAPFASAVGSDSIWAQRIVSGLLALLVFGVGIGFAGRYAATRGV